MKRFYISLFLLVSTLCSLAQATIVLSPDKDNSIYQENTNSNGAGPDIYTGANNNLNPRHGLIHFNLSSLPANISIVSVSLKLYINKLADHATGEAIKAHKLLANWGEGTADGSGRGGFADANDATWEKPFNGLPGFWTTFGGDYNPSQSGNATVGGLGSFAISGSGMAADVQSWINTPASNFGWLLAGNETVPKSALRFSSKENTNAIQRPVLEITYTTLLPVTILSFNAFLNSNDVLLNWQTGTEINNRYFGIQHSNTGTAFSEIGRVAGAGNSVLTKNYSFKHSDAASGKHYYRLAQHDFSGATHYSQVVFVVKNSKKQLLQIAPNPVQSVLQLKKNDLPGSHLYQITNSAGQVVVKGIVSAQQISVANLTKGNYLLTVWTKNGVALTSSFIKE